jgi:hypothetical protein
MSGLLERLQQTDYWMDREGQQYELIQMETTHIENALDWLKRNAPTLHRQFKDTLRAAAIFTGNDGVRLLFNQATNLAPLEWINRQPLVVAMYKELADRDDKPAPRDWRKDREEVRQLKTCVNKIGYSVFGNYKGRPELDNIEALINATLALQQRLNVLKRDVNADIVRERAEAMEDVRTGNHRGGSRRLGIDDLTDAYISGRLGF